MSSINSHYYLVGHATNGENPEAVYMKPTAENIANFIMKHRDTEVMITDELDYPLLQLLTALLTLVRIKTFLSPNCILRLYLFSAAKRRSEKLTNILWARMNMKMRYLINLVPNWNKVTEGGDQNSKTEIYCKNIL